MKKFKFLRVLIALPLVAMLLLGTAAVLLSQPWGTPIRSEPPPVSPERLRAHVTELAQTLWPRSHEHPHAAQAVAYVREQLSAMGLTPQEQVFTLPSGGTQRNVVVRLGPSTAQQTGLIVVGAHLDSYGDERVQPPTPESHTPGADDNASGVAGLIELARLLAAHPPPHPVELVAYATEEPPHFAGPHMGSAVHARALQAAGTPVRLMLSLEMIGYFSDAADSQRYPVKGLSALYGSRGNYLALIAPFTFADMARMRRIKAMAQGATALPIQSMNAPTRVPGLAFSDHRNYWALGMPAVLVTDTAFMRNPHYHQPTDTPDTLDYARMAEVVRAVHAVVLGLQQGD